MRAGDVVCDVESSDAVVEVRSEFDGVLQKIVKEKGAKDIEAGEVCAVRRRCARANVRADASKAHPQEGRSGARTAGFRGRVGSKATRPVKCDINSCASVAEHGMASSCVTRGSKQKRVGHGGIHGTLRRVGISIVRVTSCRKAQSLTVTIKDCVEFAHENVTENPQGTPRRRHTARARVRAAAPCAHSERSLQSHEARLAVLRVVATRVALDHVEVGLDDELVLASVVHQHVRDKR